jgi:uncharacterized repeat protein (TIGR01451 family)
MKFIKNYANWLLTLCGVLALVLLASFGGEWGTAYGQTAGPTPVTTSPANSTAPTVTITADPAEADPGQTVEFTLTITNPGSSSAEDVTVIDNVPPGFEVLGIDGPPGSFSTSGQTVTIRLGSLAPGQVVKIVIKTVARSSGRATNTATITATVNGRPVSTIATGPAAIDAANAGGVIPGLPRAGSGDFADEKNAELSWKIGVLIGLGILMLGLGLFKLWNKTQKKQSS